MKTNTDSVTSVNDEIKSEDFIVKTSVEKNSILVRLKLSYNTISSLVLVYLLGNEVSRTDGTSLTSLLIANVPSGMCLLIVKNSSNVFYSIPFGIVR